MTLEGHCRRVDLAYFVLWHLRHHHCVRTAAVFLALHEHIVVLQWACTAGNMQPSHLFAVQA